MTDQKYSLLIPEDGDCETAIVKAITKSVATHLERFFAIVAMSDWHDSQTVYWWISPSGDAPVAIWYSRHHREDGQCNSARVGDVRAAFTPMAAK
jgi:hypothetical protein